MENSIDKITIEMNKKYTDLREAIQYVVVYLTRQGRNCIVKSESSITVLEIDGQEYTMRLRQRIFGPLPPQAAILEKR